MKVSIILNVWGGDAARLDVTKRCLEAAFADTGWGDCEVLACDNGSQDAKLQALVRALPFLAHFRINDRNLGNYQMLNQSLLRATGDYLCVIDPDILLPAKWLGKLVEANQAIPESGISGIYTVSDHGKAAVVNGARIEVRNPGGVFGTKFFARSLLDEIGYFCEDYGVYGRGDGDYARRAALSGRTNYYLEGLEAEHLGDDVGKKSQYRRTKDESLHSQRATRSSSSNFSNYAKGRLYTPPPPASPIVTVITRHMQGRQRMTTHLRRSLEMQTYTEWQHHLITDPNPAGSGVAWANRQLASLPVTAVGDYIYVLDDDDYLTDPMLFAALASIREQHNPDLIFFKFRWPHGHFLPGPTAEHWKAKPEMGHIGMPCFMVKRAVYLKHCAAFAVERYADYEFLKVVQNQGYSEFWYDRIVGQVGRVSHGSPDDN